MLGAIIGDIAGSRYEFNNHRSKDFEFLSPRCEFTDDSILTVATAKALLESEKNDSDLSENFTRFYKDFARRYPSSYGLRFEDWIWTDSMEPYGSNGNGSAMRVSPCGDIAESLEEALELAKKSASVTHNSKEGIRGAQATAAAIYLAKTGASKEEIKDYIKDNFYDYDYGNSFTVDTIRPSYRFSETCDGSVPQAIECFLESTDYEDTIRNAISIGGDSDTIAAIAGAIAEAFYGLDDTLKEQAYEYLPEEFIEIIDKFYKRIN